MWGPVVTILWSILIGIAFLAVQFLTVAFYIFARIGDPGAKMDAVLRGLEFDGTFIGVCSLASALVCVPVILSIIKLKGGSTLKDYLGLRQTGLRQVLQWSLITCAFCLLTDGFYLLLHRPIVPEFMLSAYRTASPRWILWLGLIIAAPIFEELCFRGFIFKGLAASRLRWVGATIITALLWAFIHMQYAWPEGVVIFGLGLVFGTARAKTGSTLLTIYLHALTNLLATVEAAFALRQL